MCTIEKLEAYQQEWDDYFTYVNSRVYDKLLYEDAVYIGYGAHLGLPIDDLKYWYKDAERARVPSLDILDYIEARHDVFTVHEEDLYHLLEQDVESGALFESNGYWYSEL